jgi:putative hydroxymethylpyrimidine transport system substrate-binding protein
MNRSVSGTLLAAALAIGACTGAASPSPAPLTKVTVSQQWTINGLEDTAWVVADEMGWYAEVGLDPTFELPPTPSDPIKFVSEGRAQIAFTHSIQGIFGASEGLDFYAVATHIPKSLEQVMCRHDRGIDPNNPKSLEGKTMAQYEDPMPVLYFDLFAAQQGIDKSTMRFVSAGDDGTVVLLAGQADCVAEGVNGRAIYLTATGEEPVNWYYEEHGVPGLEWQIIAMNKAWADANPELARGFVAATLRGNTWMKENPDKALKTLLARFPELTGDRYPIAWEDMLKRNQTPYTEGKVFGYIDPGRWQAFADILFEHGLLRTRIEAKRYVTDKFLPAN